MNDKGAQRIADGELARMGRALQSIKNILKLDETGYQRFVEGLDEEVKAVYKSEVAKYVELCTVMSGVYLQWSSQLLVEVPATEVPSNMRDSSLIAAMESLVTGCMPGEKNSAIPQYLCNAADKIGKIADARRRFLEGLYAQLRPDEVDTYGELLRVCIPFCSAMPDLALYEEFYRLNLYWSYQKNIIKTPLLNVPETSKVAVARDTYERVTHICNRGLHRILAASASTERDSLAARLMLATMLNRSLWESLEFERLELVATASLLRLIRGLEGFGGTCIPADFKPEAFKKWLIQCLSAKSFPGEKNWRSLKTQHLDRFYSQAEWILRNEKNNFVEHKEPRDLLLNVCVLNLAWSYCIREKHDLRVPDVKDYDLVNGRNIENECQVALTMVMQNQRQLNSIVRSHQHYKLCARRLEIYAECNLEARRQQRHFMETNLRNASLAQWSALKKRGVSELMAQYFNECALRQMSSAW